MLYHVSHPELHALEFQKTNYEPSENLNLLLRGKYNTIYKMPCYCQLYKLAGHNRLKGEE